MTLRCDQLPGEIKNWVDIVKNDTYRCCEDQHLLVEHVLRCFREEALYIDEKRLTNYMKMADSYLPFQLFPWQKFVTALHTCTFRESDGMPRWPDLLAMVSRGAGKDGKIAYDSFVLTSPYNGIREYDVDICANNEEQAIRPVQDLTGFFEHPKNERKIKNFYSWTKERIISTRTRSVIKGRTNSPKGKDGLRSGIVVFNEIHQYQNYDNINVFTTGLGKKPHPRRSYYTTNGDVREGPLDDLLSDSMHILHGGEQDNGLLPFICRLDRKEEVDDEANWTKANPSLPYLPSLLTETRKEYREWKNSPVRLSAFMSKRMNLPEAAKESAVAEWDAIEATNKEIPEDLRGRDCTVGVDYSKSSDWMSVNFHFKRGNDRYDINHSWICSASKDLERIKAPWKDWVSRGLVTYVDDVEIHPSVVADYIAVVGRNFNIRMVCVDTFRYTLLSDALARVGISKEFKNLKLVKQLDIIKVVPVIDHCFRNGYFHWGDNPPLRWGTNNTKLIRYGKDAGADKGSFVYAKIEGKSRKTDPFMSLVASMTSESEIKERPKLVNVPVITI